MRNVVRKLVLTLWKAALHGNGMSHTEETNFTESVEQVDQEAVQAAEPQEVVVELSPLEEAQQELAKWKDHALRTAADLENFRKRAARERLEALQYGKQGLLEDLLPILDNFEMGMSAAEQDSSSMIYIGMNMVRQQLKDFLVGQGLQEVAAAGEMFDPNVHEAVSEEASDTVEEGRVVRVLRRGFKLQERLVRPASVIVAKKPEAAEA